MLFPSQTDNFSSWKQVEIKIEIVNHKNLQKNLGRTGGAANSKIVSTSSWTKMLVNSVCGFKLTKCSWLVEKNSDVMMTLQWCLCSVLNEAVDNNHSKSCVQLENQLKLLLSRLDVSSVVRTRQSSLFGCSLIAVDIVMTVVVSCNNKPVSWWSINPACCCKL